MDVEIVLNEIKGLENSKMYSIMGASLLVDFKVIIIPHSFCQKMSNFAIEPNLTYGNINYYRIRQNKRSCR